LIDKYYSNKYDIDTVGQRWHAYVFIYLIHTTY